VRAGAEVLMSFAMVGLFIAAGVSSAITPHQVAVYLRDPGRDEADAR